MVIRSLVGLLRSLCPSKVFLISDELSTWYVVWNLYFLLLALTVPHVNINEPHQAAFLLLSPIFIQTLGTIKILQLSY